MGLTITARVLGRRKPLLDDFSVPPPEGAAGDDLRLRDVIEHVVRHEVRAFEQRQQTRRFDRVLSAADIAAGAERGRVDPAGHGRPAAVDLEQAIGAALQAFEDGLYLVIIDDVERRSLDEAVWLSPDSRLTFIRLTFLAGA